MQNIQANKSYPYVAKRKGQTGLVVVSAKIGKDGRLITIEIEQSSGFVILDRDAKKLVDSVFPIKNDSGEEIQMAIPIRYKLN